jgi:hypothetical protein
MAEFAATILTLAGVARTTLKAVATLRTLSRDIKYAEKDIGRFALAIELFADQIEVANDALSPHLSKLTQSKVFNFLVKREVMGNLRKQAKSVEECIERVQPKIMTIRSSIDWVTAVRWAFFNKADIHEINPQIDSVKISLMFIMNLVILGQTEETRTKM